MTSTRLPPARVADAIAQTARRLARAGLVYGHGTDNPWDDAAALVFHCGGLRHADAPAAYEVALSVEQRRNLRALVLRRIEERVPSAYLTGVTWFAGHEMRVDARVLVPRSPIAELITAQFAPFIDKKKVRRILDLGTGSGCIAIACAHAFTEATVDAADISPQALSVARENIALHGLERRVQPVLADVYDGLPDGRYDIIVSNPPYVPTADVAALPAEYQHEPSLGLESGSDGLDHVRRILAGMRDRLNPGGILVVEVGNTDDAVARSWPDLPFLWLDFEHGGGGVFLLRLE
jgi:ribosomal protein L3 glutamine methyltransferase